MMRIPRLIIQSGICFLTVLALHNTGLSQSGRTADTRNINDKRDAEAWVELQMIGSLSQDTGVFVEGARERINWSDIAQNYRNFQRNHPDSQHLLEARKLELVAELTPLLGAGAASSTLETKIQTYLADVSVPETDRFKIRYMQKNARININDAFITGRLMNLRFENARDLVDEYPNEPQAWRDLLWLSQRSNTPPPARFMSRAKGSHFLPENIKLKLLNLRQRFELVGRALPEAGLSIPSGKSVMLYFWSIEKPQFLEVLQHCAQVDGWLLIGVNIDGNKEKAGAFAEQLSLPGALYYDGPDGRLAAVLHVDEAPVVFLLDETGVVVDVNGRFDLISKMRQMRQNISPDRRVNTAFDENMEVAQ